MFLKLYVTSLYQSLEVKTLNTCLTKKSKIMINSTKREKMKIRELQLRTHGPIHQQNVQLHR